MTSFAVFLLVVLFIMQFTLIHIAIKTKDSIDFNSEEQLNNLLLLEDDYNEPKLVNIIAIINAYIIEMDDYYVVTIIMDDNNKIMLRYKDFSRAKDTLIYIQTNG